MYLFSNLEAHLAHLDELIHSDDYIWIPLSTESVSLNSICISNMLLQFSLIFPSDTAWLSWTVFAMMSQIHACTVSLINGVCDKDKKLLFMKNHKRFALI